MSRSEEAESWPIPPSGGPSIGPDERYRLALKLGEGGMASVYRAWDTVEEGWVAVKVLLPEYARRKKLRKRFENEASTMLKLDHRNIIRVFDVGADSPLPYIAMEIADGGCVIDWIEAYGPMPPRMAVDVVMQACKGLNAAHALGVVHRDVKPHNILITRRGVCRLTDFGIAQVDDSGGMTKTGSVMGTLGYMAPEQRTDSKNVDVRADIYGLGATLYKLVTGGTVADLFLAEHDTELLDGVPQALVPIVLKSTSYKPSGRYATVRDLAKELHRAKKSLPADPHDTPALPMPMPMPTDALVSASEPSEPTYAPMGDPFGFTDPSVEPESLSDPYSDPSGVIPYQMPEQEARAADPDYLPAYIDQQSLPASGVQKEEIALDEESKQALDERYKRAFAAGLIDAHGNPIEEPVDAEEQRGSKWDPVDDLLDYAKDAVVELLELAMRPLQFLAVGATIIGVVFSITLYGAAGVVNQAAADAVMAQKHWFNTLNSEKQVMSDLQALGADKAVLESFWFDYERAETDVDREVAARKLVSRLTSTDQHVRQFGSELMPSKLRMARERLNRIEYAMTQYDNALTNWELIADTPRGRFAVGFGVASRPPDG